MKLSAQVCSLEQAKRLKELGVVRESTWYYHSLFYGAGRWEKVSILDKGDFELHQYSYEGMALFLNITTEDPDYPVNAEEYSAYTLAELMQMLPDIFFSNSKKSYGQIIVEKADGKSICYKKFQEETYVGRGVVCETLAQAAAQLLTELIEAGEVAVEECNRRLSG